jgi:putative ABC transport system substrate-binding protein
MDGLLVQFDFLFVVMRNRIAELAAEGRIPAIYENRTQVLAGGLMSYGADLRENYRQGAVYVDRILKGARPGDLPVVQASRFELILNTAAVKALGLTVPDNLLARADEVI